MENRIVRDSARQRGLRIGKTHAEELVSLYGAHAQSEFYRADDLLLINYAHVVMLYEKGIVRPDGVARTASAPSGRGAPVMIRTV